MTLLARLHGGCCLATGVWPVVDIDSFQAVTGAKTDLGLVKTVGLLIFVIGAAAWASAHRRIPSAEIAILTVGSALALGSVDVDYPARRRHLEDLPARRPGGDSAGAGRGVDLPMDSRLPIFRVVRPQGTIY